MHIRSYEASDYTGCLLAFDSNYPEFFADHERQEFQMLLGDLAQKKDDGQLHYYVVDVDGELAACAGFFLPGAKSEPAGLVWGMVARSFHRQGIGKALLTFRLAKIQELRPGTDVVLDTTQLSFPFFEKLGFRRTRVTKDFYAPGLDRYDMVLRSVC